MDNFLMELRQQSRTIGEIADKIEQGESYLDELRSYLPELNETFTKLFGMLLDPAICLDINQNFILQVLNDIIYGIENEDSVFLLDVLRYGLSEVYSYVDTELRGEEHHE